MKTLPVEKNEQMIVEICDLSYEGYGVAKVDGYPLFIENALPGEKIEVLVVKAGKQFGYGKALNYLTESPNRVPLTDQALLQTGIAPLQQMDYTSQLEFKRKQVVNVMERIAHFSNVEVQPVIGMEQPYAYRNKAQIPVRKLNGQLETGFFRKNSHQLIPIEHYYIQNQEIDTVVQVVRDIMRRFHVKPYEETSHTGNLRTIVVRRGYYTGEIMVGLVTRTNKLFPAEKIAAAIVAELPKVVSIVQNIQPERTNVILGKTNKLLYGRPYIEDKLLGKTYQISLPSFYQVNTQQAEKLYQTAFAFAELSKDQTVIDAYCGIGTIALSLADKVKHVYGIEVVEEAIIDANLNAKRNQIDNALFTTGKAEKVLNKWQEQGMKADTLFVDPPRKGLDADFIQAAAAMYPAKIIYISCNPATLARDCKLFAEKNYQIEKIQPVDLFPQTTHVETVVLLTRID